MPPSCLCRFCFRCRFRLFPLRWPLPSPAFAVSASAAASGFFRSGGRCRLRLLPFRLPLPLPAFAVSVAVAVSGFCRFGGRCRFRLFPLRWPLPLLAFAEAPGRPAERKLLPHRLPCPSNLHGANGKGRTLCPSPRLIGVVQVSGGARGVRGACPLRQS